MSELLSVTAIDVDPRVYVRVHAEVLTEFSHLTQDSGNVSWLVESGGRRLFVKTAGTDTPPPDGAPVPYFDHAGRVRLVRTAIELARSCDHPALPTLLNVIESPGGPVLVYEAAPGELIGVPAERRADPTSAYQRFAHLPADDLLSVFDTFIDLQRALADQGWVAGDLYDGCLILDFPSRNLHVVDLDTYRRGPSVNDMGRMFGSTRFMAPEEHRLGATLDQRTTVFTLGRHVWHFATRLTEDPRQFCGTPELAAVTHRAIRPDRADRYPSVLALAEAWSAARSGD